MSKLSKSLEDAIRKALTVAGDTAGKGADFIPTPLATEFIGFVRDENFCRQLFTSVPMTAPTRDYPKILGGSKVYYQSAEGGTVSSTLNQFKTGTVRLEAKKFMTEVILSEEVIEDSTDTGDIEMIVQDHFIAQLAAAEEEVMIAGNPAHTPTTATEASADETTWYTKDHRLAFYGLLTLAADITGDLNLGTRAANRVNAGALDMSATIVRNAIYNMGKYGRTMSNLVLMINPWSISQLLDDSKLTTLEKYGPNATIFTGEVGKLWGKVTVINSPFVTDGYGVITHKSNPMIGDRRLIKVARDVMVSEDARKFVLSERMDFQVQYLDALCQIYNLDLPSSAS
jgi:hypothetical protein